MAAMEKRRASRVKHDSVLEIYDGEGRLVVDAVRLVDLSTEGARFSSTEQFPVGARIRGCLRSLKEGILSVSGRIVWTQTKANARLYGLKFDHPPEPLDPGT